jgi:very-long-chain ceramide synthase
MSFLTSRPSMSRLPSTASAISTMPVQPHNKEASDRRRARAASNTSKPLDSLVESTHRHTWIIPGAITFVIAGLWLALNPKDPGNPFRPFVLLSYTMMGSDGQIVYGKGRKDLMFCAFYTAFFAFLRELTMETMLAPLARKTGLRKSKQGRFMEQCYSCVQYTVFGVYGVVISSVFFISW